MTGSIDLNWVPLWALASIILFILLLIAGWIVATIGVIQSKRSLSFRILVIFPLTHPLGMLGFLFKDWTRARRAVGVYTAAIVVLLLGGWIADRIEQSRLDALVEELEANGESLSYESMIPEPVPEEENVWGHPFLENLVTQSRHDAAGEAARSAEPYKAMEIPRSVSEITYTESNRPLYLDGFKGFHQDGISIIAAQSEDFSVEDIPGTWQGLGQAVIDYYRDAEPQFAQLREAIERPYDQYPLQWPEGEMMLLPHLYQLKTFSRSASLRCRAFAATGDTGTAFREAQVALQLVKTGHSDLLISRLVQMSQASVALRGIQTAQSFHPWEEAQWVKVDEALAHFDFPADMPDSFRAERIFSAASFQPMFDELPSRAIYGFSTYGFETKLQTKLILDYPLRFHFRASLKQQWSGCLLAYRATIDNAISQVETGKHRPWSEMESTLIEQKTEQFGVLAQALVPAFSKSIANARRTQAQVQLGRVAIALERYRIRHGEYPTDLDPVLAEYPNVPRFDPMSRQPWIYQRLEGDGFQLHHVGENGHDDGGIYDQSNASGSRDNDFPDDVAWLVYPELPPLPEFTYEAKMEPSEEDLLKIMEAYGISPEEINGDAPESPSE